MCQECYIENDRATPMLNPRDCLRNHTQYICGTCGRCICIEKDPHRSLQRWNFPFKSLDIAKNYLRAADYTMKKACGIYEIMNEQGRKSYKIMASDEDLVQYLSKHKHQHVEQLTPLFTVGVYQSFPNTEIRKLRDDEVEQYLLEQQ